MMQRFCKFIFLMSHLFLFFFYVNIMTALDCPSSFGVEKESVHERTIEGIDAFMEDFIKRNHGLIENIGQSAYFLHQVVQWIQEVPQEKEWTIDVKKYFSTKMVKIFSVYPSVLDPFSLLKSLFYQLLMEFKFDKNALHDILQLVFFFKDSPGVLDGYNLASLDFGLQLELMSMQCPSLGGLYKKSVHPLEVHHILHAKNVLQEIKKKEVILIFIH